MEAKQFFTNYIKKINEPCKVFKVIDMINVLPLEFLQPLTCGKYVIIRQSVLDVLPGFCNIKIAPDVTANNHTHAFHSSHIPSQMSHTAHHNSLPSATHQQMGYTGSHLYQN